MNVSANPRAAACSVVALFLAAAVAWSLLPHGLGRDIVEPAIPLAAAGVTALGARGKAGPGQRGWLWLIAALLLLGAGDALDAVVSRGGAAPSAAEAVRAAGSIALLGTLVYLARRRGGIRNRGALVDALIVGAAFFSLIWLAMIDDAVDGTSAPLMAALASVSATAALLAAATATAVFVSPGVRHEAIVLLTGATFLLFASAVLHGSQIAGDSAAHLVADGITEALACALAAAASLFPARGPQPRVPLPQAAGLTSRRIGVVSLVSLVPVLILAIKAPRGVDNVEVVVYGVATAVVVGAALLRTTGLLAATRRALRREEILRRAAAALAASPDRRTVHQATVDSALAFVDDARARTSLAMIVDGGMRVIAAAGHGALGLVGLELGPDAASIARGAMGERSVALRASSVPGVDTSIGDDPLTIFPLVVGGESIGVLSVRTTLPLGDEERAALETLAVQSALALDGMVRAETAAQSRIERRFQALVRNATDLITVVDERMTVRFQSPSLQVSLGWSPDEVLGARPVGLVHPEDRRRILLYWRKVRARPGVHQPVDFRARTRNGEWRTVETVANNLLDDEDVGGVVLTTRDVTDRRDLETRLAHQAFHDELTGLPNRALFNDRVEHSLAVAEREARSVAVLFLDLDDFKEVNDSLGHQAGDLLLIETARRIEACLRQGDTAARLSGDEFGILLERATKETATQVAERVLEQLLRPLTIAGKELFLRASVGIALSPADGRSAEELLRNADTAMYRAKGAGKSSFALFKPSMHAAALQRLELRSELEEAAQRGELSLRYQPVFDLAGGRIGGLEALLRWTHPRRGLIQPSTFITLAEETGSIVPIGAWVFETALQQLKAWELRWPEQARDLWLSVNLSTRQLAEPSLPATLAAIVERTEVDPGRIVVEVTESVLIADAEAAARRLAALRDLGLRVAIDDFGTGYSSLGVLEQMPVDILKIASRFVERLGTDEHRPRLVEALVRLGDTLGLPTVAEGIENVTQLTVLQLLGCEMGQGFYLSRPLRVDRVEGLLARAAAGDPLRLGER